MSVIIVFLGLLFNLNLFEMFLFLLLLLLRTIIELCVIMNFSYIIILVNCDIFCTWTYFFGVILFYNFGYTIIVFNCDVFYTKNNITLSHILMSIFMIILYRCYNG